MQREASRGGTAREHGEGARRLGWWACIQNVVVGANAHHEREVVLRGSGVDSQVTIAACCRYLIYSLVSLGPSEFSPLLACCYTLH